MEVLQWKEWTGRSSRSGIPQLQNNKKIIDRSVKSGQYWWCLGKHPLDVAFQTFHCPVACFIQILLFRWGWLFLCSTFLPPCFNLFFHTDCSGVPINEDCVNNEGNVRFPTLPATMFRVSLKSNSYFGLLKQDINGKCGQSRKSPAA